MCACFLLFLLCDWMTVPAATFFFLSCFFPSQAMDRYIDTPPFFSVEKPNRACHLLPCLLGQIGLDRCMYKCTLTTLSTDWVERGQICGDAVERSILASNRRKAQPDSTFF